MLVQYIHKLRLHKAIYTCAEDLAEGRETDEYINYCVRRVEMLQSYSIRVVMVFDGGKLPSKNNTEDERERYSMQILK